MPSLYIHIPFCEKKCIYCDFYSIENMSSTNSFLEALHREIQLYAQYGKGTSFGTIFFGGGTPSLLAPQQIEGILSHLHSTFTVEKDAEITLETNPGTVNAQKLAAYRGLGINRLSIGIQSFHEDELEFLGRIHDSMQAIDCVRLARDAGFDNLNIDLIYSLPGQTLGRWERNLVYALALQPEHLSANSLIVEENTPLARMVRQKQVFPNPPESEADLYELTMQTMEARGYEHYEVSNYAKPGYRSRHNYSYWCHENYLGFGPSAHSFWKNPGDITGFRWWNLANVSHYCRQLLVDRLPLGSQEFLMPEVLITERIFLGLRSDGLDLKKFQTDFGSEILFDHQDIINQLVAEDKATLHNDALRLTSKGYLLCDEISERLLPNLS
jgi:oxygen-independent coproporphyrinogen-3 oxidase